MPMDFKKYPKNWREISKRIRKLRAEDRCEWCNLPNKQKNPRTGSPVLLTVAHLGAPHPDGRPGDKHDKMDVREENLAALCQQCHLNYDRVDHIYTKRRNKTEQQGLLPLFDTTPFLFFKSTMPIFAKILPIGTENQILVRKAFIAGDQYGIVITTWFEGLYRRRIQQIGTEAEAIHAIQHYPQEEAEAMFEELTGVKITKNSLIS